RNIVSYSQFFVVSTSAPVGLAVPAVRDDGNPVVVQAEGTTDNLCFAAGQLVWNDRAGVYSANFATPSGVYRLPGTGFSRDALRFCCPPYDTVCLAGCVRLMLGDLIYHGAHSQKPP